MNAEMLEDVFSMADGQAVIIQWPQNMDSEFAEDMKDWPKLVSGKIQRAFAEPSPNDKPDDEND